MVYGLRQFRPYILGHRTVVRFDHAALMLLKRAKEPVGQQSRWLDFIKQFALDLQHRKGASHSNADALSRRPYERQGDPCRQCSSRLDDREDSAAARDGIPAGRQSSERPKVPRDASPETASSRTVTTRARDRQQRRQAAAENPAGVDYTTATVPLRRVGGSRRASTETAETVKGRPGQAGLRRRRLKSIWAIPSLSGRIRPDQAGSGQIRSGQP